MAMFGNMGGLRPLPNGMLAGPDFPTSPGAPIGGGQLTPMSNGMMAGPSFPTTPVAASFNPAPAPSPATSAPAPMPASQPTSMFGGLSRGHLIAGLIGDALQKASGGQATFMPYAMQRQQDAEIVRRQAAEQAAQFKREIALEAWKRAHPAPGAPHYWQTNDGSLAQVGQDGQPHVLYQDPTPKTTWLTADNGDGTKQIIPMTANGPVGTGAPAASSGAALPPGYTVRPKGGAASGPRTFPAEAAYAAIVQQESGGRVGVTGPQTRYGRAQGVSQMLPATAQSMAAKLGLPWRPDLMTATSDVAAQYQRALGRAYFEEGLEKTGNVHDAARYYHGGPDRRLWGPKTNAYADRIVASLEA